MGEMADYYEQVNFDYIPDKVFYYGKVIVETNKAYLFEFTDYKNQQQWIPKSQSELENEGIVLTSWLESKIPFLRIEPETEDSLIDDEIPY